MSSSLLLRVFIIFFFFQKWLEGKRGGNTGSLLYAATRVLLHRFHHLLVCPHEFHLERGQLDDIHPLNNCWIYISSLPFQWWWIKDRTMARATAALKTTFQNPAPDMPAGGDTCPLVIYAYQRPKILSSFLRFSAQLTFSLSTWNEFASSRKKKEGKGRLFFFFYDLIGVSCDIGIQYVMVSLLVWGIRTKALFIRGWYKHSHPLLKEKEKMPFLLPKSHKSACPLLILSASVEKNNNRSS